MLTLSFRHAVVADLPFIVGLSLLAAVGPLDDDPDAADPAYAEALRAIDADPNQELFVAEDAGQPVGTFQLSYLPGLMRRGSWRGLIEAVHITPARRSEGLGGQMIGWAVERCRARGCSLVQLTSNKARLDAHRFYRRLGFEQSHEGFKLYL